MGFKHDKDKTTDEETNINSNDPIIFQSKLEIRILIICFYIFGI